MLSFTEIYTKKFNQVYKNCYRMLLNHAIAEEATQETMYKLMVSFDSVDQSKINAWLKRVAENTCIDILRKKTTEDKTIAELSSVPDTAGAELMYDAIEISKTLPPKLREIFHLAFEVGLHNKEIAEHLQIPLTTVKYRLSVCLHKIAAKLR